MSPDSILDAEAQSWVDPTLRERRPVLGNRPPRWIGRARDPVTASGLGARLWALWGDQLDLVPDRAGTGDLQVGLGHGGAGDKRRG